MLHRTDDWAELDAGGFILSIHGGYKGSSSRHQRPLGLHFICKDIDRSIRLVRKYGGRVGRIRTAKEARFHDPDGNEFELRQVVSIG